MYEEADTDNKVQLLQQTQILPVGQELVQTLRIPNLVSSIEQEASEGVVVASVVTEETSDGQVDGYFVPSLQVQGHNNSGAVLLVLHISLSGSCHHPGVHQQTGAGRQGVAGRAGVAVDSQGQAVDTRAGDREDTGVCTVATAQVDEDMLVGDELIITIGAKAFQIGFIGQSH